MTKNENITYGHRHLGFWFRPVLTLISSDGFEYRSKLYKWEEVVKIKRYDSFIFAFLFHNAGAPLSYIFLKDGSKIVIHGRSLEKSGEKPKISFFRGVSKSYNELMNLIQEKIKKA